MREFETETSVVWPAWCYSGETHTAEESPQTAASPSLLVAAAAAAAAASTTSATIANTTRSPSQSPKTTGAQKQITTSTTIARRRAQPAPAGAASMNSSPFSKMLTDHMLNNLQETNKKFPFNASTLIAAAAAKNYSDYNNGAMAADYGESRIAAIKSERLSPPNLKTEIEIEPQSSIFSRSPSSSPTTPSRTPPRMNDQIGYTSQVSISDDPKPRHLASDGRDTNFLPPPPNQFNARNYSDIMRSLAAKYNSCNNENLSNPQPPPSFGDARPNSSNSQSKPPHTTPPTPETYSNLNQHSPNSVNPINLLTGLRFSPAMFPPFMDMSSTQTLLTLAKVAKEAEMQKLKSGIKSFDHVALTRQIGQLLSVASSTSSTAKNHQSNGANETTASPLDLSSAPMTKRIKLSPDSPTAASSTKSSLSSGNNNNNNNNNNSNSNSKDGLRGDSLSPGLSSTGNRPNACEREAASNEINAWTVDQVCDFVSSIDICAEYTQNFKDQSIDGTGLQMLTEDHLTGSLGMKLGPALKLKSLLAKKLLIVCNCSSCSVPSSSECLPRPASSDPLSGHLNTKLD